MEFNEEIFRNQAEKEISECRPGDWNHALRVVEWVKKLGVDRNDLYLLIATAYIHDIGWRGVLSKEKITFDELLKFEKKAKDNSEKFVKKFLSKKGFSEDEIRKVNRLVSAADEHNSELDDEKIIVDADNLSKLHIDHLKEKYQKTEWIKILHLFKEKFPSRIKTKIGKSLYPKLLANLKNQIMPK